jgi:hypothetical protein
MKNDEMFPDSSDCLAALSLPNSRNPSDGVRKPRVSTYPTSLVPAPATPPRVPSIWGSRGKAMKTVATMSMGRAAVTKRKAFLLTVFLTSYTATASVLFIYPPRL